MNENLQNKDIKRRLFRLGSWLCPYSRKIRDTNKVSNMLNKLVYKLAQAARKAGVDFHEEKRRACSGYEKRNSQMLDAR